MAVAVCQLWGPDLLNNLKSSLLPGLDIRKLCRLTGVHPITQYHSGYVTEINMPTFMVIQSQHITTDAPDKTGHFVMCLDLRNNILSCQI